MYSFVDCPPYWKPHRHFRLSKCKINFIIFNPNLTPPISNIVYQHLNVLISQVTQSRIPSAVHYPSCSLSNHIQMIANNYHFHFLQAPQIHPFLYISGPTLIQIVIIWHNFLSEVFFFSSCQISSFPHDCQSQISKICIKSLSYVSLHWLPQTCRIMFKFLGVLLLRNFFLPVLSSTPSDF